LFLSSGQPCTMFPQQRFVAQGRSA
jgi:hypothetical protein